MYSLSYEGKDGKRTCANFFYQRLNFFLFVLFHWPCKQIFESLVFFFYNEIFFLHKSKFVGKSRITSRYLDFYFCPMGFLIGVPHNHQKKRMKKPIIMAVKETLQAR